MTGDKSLKPRVGGPASGIPAHGSRPDFPKNNTLAITGGHRSPRVYGEVSKYIAAGLLEDRPELANYPEAVAAWATAEAQAALLRRYLNEIGTIDENGQPREGHLHWLKVFEKSAMQHRATLGLDPRSEAQLARERAAASILAVDLDALAERGREALANADEDEDEDLVGDVLERISSAGKTSWDELQAEHNRKQDELRAKRKGKQGGGGNGETN